jgi:hypothetical protein
MHTHTHTYSFVALYDNKWCMSQMHKRIILLKKNEHLHDVISLKSTFIHANPCLFRILDKLFVLVLHHLLPMKEKKERMTTTTHILSTLILTCICLQNNGSLRFFSLLLLLSIDICKIFVCVHKKRKRLN